MNNKLKTYNNAVGVRTNDDSPVRKNQLPQRKSVRLDGYDYAQEGLYFITICCHKFKCLFGEIYKDEMHLNNAGKMAQQCWQEIPSHYPQVKLHQFVIMPNHLHGIIEILPSNNHSPETTTVKKTNGTSNTIGAMVRGFKIGVTKWMKQNTNVTTVWQRSFYEHIIKTEKAHENIADYIIENPLNWSMDKFYVGANHHSPVTTNVKK